MARPLYLSACGSHLSSGLEYFSPIVEILFVKLNCLYCRRHVDHTSWPRTRSHIVCPPVDALTCFGFRRRNPLPCTAAKGNGTSSTNTNPSTSDSASHKLVERRDKTLEQKKGRPDDVYVLMTLISLIRDVGTQFLF